MARLRGPQLVVGDPSALPEELRTCWVEDWASPPPPTQVDHYVSSVHPHPDADTAAWFLQTVGAWGRWKAARHEWAEQHDVDWRDLPGGGAPRRRQTVEV